MTAASLAEDTESDTAEDRRAAREDRAVSRREAKRLKAESKQSRRREKAEAKAMAKARRERHTIEARVEREKAQLEHAVEADEVEDLVVEDVVVDEPALVEESGEPQGQQDKPLVDQDTAIALAVAAARPEAVSRVVDPIQVASEALDREDEDAAAEQDEPSRRPTDAVSASLSDRAAAQLAKRRRREEERAAREAERAAQQETEAVTAEQPAVETASHDDDPTMDRVRRAALTAFDVPEPRAPRADEEDGGSSLLTTVISVIGIIGYICAVVLALGAMSVALGFAKGDALFDLFEPVARLLVSPIRGLFSFSGDNGETKELFLAYSVGSVIYLAIGLVAQNLPRVREQA